jgi:hypothetical protein
VNRETIGQRRGLQSAVESAGQFLAVPNGLGSIPRQRHRIGGLGRTVLRQQRKM